MTGSHEVGQVPGWIEELGIVDRGTGITCARNSRQLLENAAKQVIGRTGEMTTGHILLMGLATRTTGLHDGAVHALETDDPGVAFTLLRAYAENAAALLYAADHPNKVSRMLGLDGTNPIKVGTLTNHAQQGSERFGAFREIYEQLSGFAHPMSKSIFASTMPTENGFEWTLQPVFKSDYDFVVASAWVVELAVANAHLFYEFADSQGW
ncbi:hypothetical protein [Nocardia asteroides]|uniref:hypothetical protein n=1 Tax=Nocardia asteroides TaxID=1824 RepID=UPI0034498A87